MEKDHHVDIGVVLSDATHPIIGKKRFWNLFDIRSISYFWQYSSMLYLI